MIYIDSFAGGGGASTGIKLAIGRDVDIAINHDIDAIRMHKVNHPGAKHYREDVWKVDPVEACGGQPVRLAWFSPDCKHFSRAKGAALVSKKIRGLAWVVLRWAATVKPDVIMLENVPEFVTWGPVRKGKPIKALAGTTYEKWRGQLEALGYAIDTRELTACDYGAPTSRRRFYLIARRDGQSIVWPEPTHGDPDSLAVRGGLLKPWKSAASVIDWTLPCPSVFDSAETIKGKYGIKAVRPLRDNTMSRIAIGLDRYVIKSAKPYIIQGKYTQTSKDREALVAAHITPFFDGGYKKCGQDARKPLPTVTGVDHNAIEQTYLIEFKGASTAQPIDEPLRTITASIGEFGAVRGTVTQYDPASDTGHWCEVRAMLNQFCGYALQEDEILLLEIGGKRYYISDIGLRMLTPRELFDAQGFPHDYIIDRDAQGKPYPKSAQVARCGNAVCPPVARALVEANVTQNKAKTE